MRGHCSSSRGFSPLLFALAVCGALALPGCGDATSASSAAALAVSESTALGVPRERSVPLGNGKISLVLEFIPKGEFSMGTATSKSIEDEAPHRVVLDHSFYMAKTELTQAQYSAVIGTNPCSFMGADLPVENVTWDEAAEYCKKVSELLHETVRLPTEEEWEYACRAGTTSEYYTGSDEAALAKAAWYSANSQERTHAAGHLAANAWGLCDLHGSVWEFCLDQRIVPIPDPKDPSKKTNTDCRMLRGGSWMDQPGDCRAASRTLVQRNFRNPNIGFRVVVELKK